MDRAEARKGKPTTVSPLIMYRTNTYKSKQNPKIAKKNPSRLATCKGITEKPVTMFMAWMMSFRTV